MTTTGLVLSILLGGAWGLYTAHKEYSWVVLVVGCMALGSLVFVMDIVLDII